MPENKYPLLDQIRLPADLRELDETQLPAVADQLRNYLIDAVSSSGGHFGAGLGCIELTVALHYLYNTPSDRIVWARRRTRKTGTAIRNPRPETFIGRDRRSG